jgi:hypothetical protein
MTQDSFASPTIAPRRLLPRWLVLTPIIATPLLIVAVIYLIACWRAHDILQQEIRHIRERGEPLRFADLAPYHDDAEAVARGKEVAALADRLRSVPGDFLAEVATKGIRPADVKQIEETVAPYLADVQAIVDELRGGTCVFEYDYQTRDPYSIVLRHLDNLQKTAGVLAADAHLALVRGDNHRASQRVHDMFALDEALRHEPFVVSQLVRRAIGNRSLDLLQLVIGHEAATEADLGVLDERLGELEEGFRLASCLRAERAVLFDLMEDLGRPGVEQIFSSASMSTTKATGLKHWWGSWPYRPRRLHQQAIMLRTLTRWADLVDRPGPAAGAQYTAACEQIGRGELPILDALLGEPINESTVRDPGLHYRQRLLSARLALAVVRHRVAHDALPASLDELAVPPTSRLGLLSGKPLVYQPTLEGETEGFAIYDELHDKGQFEVRLVGR